MGSSILFIFKKKTDPLVSKFFVEENFVDIDVDNNWIEIWTLDHSRDIESELHTSIQIIK